MEDSSLQQRMTPPDEFWSDFKSRARMYPQAAPARMWIAPLFFRRAIAAGCMVMALVGISYYWLSEAVVEATQIQSVEVIASHSAVLIMEGESSDGAILWVVDMEADGGGGET